MELRVHEDEGCFSALHDEWNELLRRSAADSVFSTWEWQSNWWAAYQPGRLWVVTCRDDDGRLLGIAPWFIEDRGDERVVRGIGCVDVTDYVDVIVDGSCTGIVYNCFAHFLAENASQYDRINLCNLPATSPTLEHFPTVLETRGFTTQIVQQEVCPVIELPETWEDYLQGSLDKKQRHELRRKLRNAENSVDWYTVTAEHDLDGQLQKFLALMADSQREKAIFLNDPQHIAFFKRVMPAMHRCGWLKLDFLTMHDQPIAAYLNFAYNGRVLVYNSGLMREHMQISPGIVLLGHIIRDAIERDYQVFDFLRGNEEYKYRMGGTDTTVHMLKAQLA